MARNSTIIICVLCFITTCLFFLFNYEISEDVDFENNGIVFYPNNTTKIWFPYKNRKFREDFCYVDLNNKPKGKKSYPSECLVKDRHMPIDVFLELGRKHIIRLDVNRTKNWRNSTLQRNGIYRRKYPCDQVWMKDKSHITSIPPKKYKKKGKDDEQLCFPVFFHIGAQKTGTTTFRDTLDHIHDQLTLENKTNYFIHSPAHGEDHYYTKVLMSHEVSLMLSPPNQPQGIWDPSFQFKGNMRRLLSDSPSCAILLTLRK